VTSVFANPPRGLAVAQRFYEDRGVYAPHHDSQLLCDVMRQTGLAPGRRIADFCTGSGVVAITAAKLGASSVTAFDVSDAAVRVARANAAEAGADVDVRLANCVSATEFGPFDLVVCNPPYVPQPPADVDEHIPPHAGPPQAYNAGGDGRLVLDPLCAMAPELLSGDGTLLIVQSEFSGVDPSLSQLRSGGLKASVVARQWIPFGPVMRARAEWLERVGLLDRGRRVEQLVVIRADVP
jgi:release factor glutamine methyltransferase